MDSIIFYNQTHSCKTEIINQASQLFTRHCKTSYADCPTATSNWRLFYNTTEGSLNRRVSYVYEVLISDGTLIINCVSWNKLRATEGYISTWMKNWFSERKKKKSIVLHLLLESQSVSHYWVLMAEERFLGEEGLNETAWLGLVWHYPGESNRITTGSEVNSWQTHTNTHCIYTDTADEGTKHQLSDLGPGTLCFTVHMCIWVCSPT